MEVEFKVDKFNYENMILVGQLMVVVGSSLITVGKVVLGKKVIDERLDQQTEAAAVQDRNTPTIGGGYFDQ